MLMVICGWLIVDGYKSLPCQAGKAFLPLILHRLVLREITNTRVVMVTEMM